MGLKIFTILVFAEIFEFFWTAAQYDTLPTVSYCGESLHTAGSQHPFLKTFAQALIEAVSRDFCIFFLHESNPFGFLINSLKWFCWKTLFCKDIHEKRDSACDTAPSRNLRSVIMREVQLRAVLACAESNFFLFSKTYIFMTFRIYVMIFRKHAKIFWKSKNG